MALLFRNATKLLIKSTNNARKEVVGYAESSSPIINQDDIENDVHKKCLLNGTFDWKIGSFKQDYFSPDNIILNQIPRNYDESKTWDNIEKHVKEIIPDDKDRQSFYDFLSLVLMPYNGIPMILFLVGVSGSGKSQLGLLTQMLFGKNNFSSSTLQDITKDDTTRGNIAYNLVNCDFDMKHNKAPEISILKKIGTQDEMSGRGIYEQTAKYRPSFRFMGLGNSLFQLVDVDDAEAVYERSYIIRLNRKFRDTEDEVRNVFQTIADLDDELDGFMTYLLNNAKWIYENQEIHYPQSTKKTEELWNLVGNQVSKFSEIWIEHGSGNKGERTGIHQKWLDYQIENNLKPIGRNKWYEIFEELNAVVATNIRESQFIEYWGYQGIRLRSQEEVDKILNHKETSKEKVLRLLKKITNPEDLRFGQVMNILDKP
jgi:phage/plasmid-associated DNA primase